MNPSYLVSLVKHIDFVSLFYIVSANVETYLMSETMMSQKEDHWKITETDISCRAVSDQEPQKRS